MWLRSGAGMVCLIEELPAAAIAPVLISTTMAMMIADTWRRYHRYCVIINVAHCDIRLCPGLRYEFDEAIMRRVKILIKCRYHWRADGRGNQQNWLCLMIRR